MQRAIGPINIFSHYIASQPHLLLANRALPEPLPLSELHRIASAIGADVPFFLHGGTQLATGDGSEVRPVDLA